MDKKDRFIPNTMEREIAKNIVFRPVRSWHSATYAGEKLEKIPNSNDGSGCMKKVLVRGFEWEMCHIPQTVTHRLYWHKKNPNEKLSVFLSYPNAMGSWDTYFWELYPYKDDIKCFDSEKEMERVVIRILKGWLKKKDVKYNES